MKKINFKAQTALISVAAILVIVLLCFLFFVKSNKPRITTAQPLVNYDKAMLNVFENNLMQEPLEADYKSRDYKIDGCYFDGIRLYLKINSALECKDGFSVKTGGKEFGTDVFVSGRKDNVLLKDEDYFIVFNSLSGADLSELILHYENQEICEFAVKDSFAKEESAEAYFEELQLIGIQFGKTSTLINCKISANIEGKSFQIMKDGEVIRVYVLNRSGDTFSLLIPVEMKKNSQFDLISNNGNSAELRIPINLAYADFK